MRSDQIRDMHTPRADGRAVCRAFLIAAIALTLSLAMGGCGGDDDGAQPPVLAPIGDRTVVLGSDLLIAVSASDPEGAPVTLLASGLPENSYFLPDSGIFCLFADLEEQLEQPIQITFTASDGSLTSSETITIRVVRPDAAAVVALGVLEDFTLDPIGNHSVPPGQSLTLQLSASGASPIVYRMYPEPALAPVVTLDPTSGEFRFSPTAEQAGEEFEITFQACDAEGTGCSAIVQAHETVHLVAAPGTPLTIANQTGAATTVYINFGADSAIKPADWASFCTKTGDLNCNFPLGANSSKLLPNPNGKYINIALAFGSTVSCGSTKAELNINNPNWYDVMDVSLVDGFSNKIKITSTGLSQPLGPPVGATGNQSVYGVFPVGCDICVQRKNPPCGIPPGPPNGDGCKAGTESNPNPICQTLSGNIGGGGESVEVALVP